MELSARSAPVPITVELERSFRQAWFLLYSRGVGPGYIEALRRFVQTAVRAYREEYSLAALGLEFAAHQFTTGNPELDTFVQMNEEEIQIRTLWLKLIYLTLDQKAGKPLPEAETNPDLFPLVTGALLAYRQGYSLESLKLEMLLEGEPRSQAEASILSQWLRIIFLTLEASKV